ncbi:RDD family protein [Lacticaseibacillus sp. 866-1]|uniref:RDD family protein n=1 Tax=Lacticaseibacillus sp. 866-1 TaxID=2799576 RepID=UPI001941F843|nr:RDD family protein [Lacticaseibacillus sp. 866-1]
MAKRKRKDRPNAGPNQVPEPVLAPDHGNARVLSGVLDWVLGGIVSGLPAVLIYAVLSGKSKPMTSMYMFHAAGISDGATLATTALCLLFGFFYYVIVPWRIYPWQTVGKHLNHVQIVRRDGKPLTLGLLILRQFVFLVCIEGLATATSTYVKVFITLATKFYVDGYFTAVWTVITIISMVLVFWNKKHLALHDWALGTMVVAKPAK